jgi:hypothetical protein
MVQELANPEETVNRSIMNDRGQYGQRHGYAMQPWSDQAPWSESQRQAFQRSLAVSALGSVAGAVLWKSHRIWGFLLGGMAGGAVGNLAFAPPTSFP